MIRQRAAIEECFSADDNKQLEKVPEHDMDELDYAWFVQLHVEPLHNFSRVKNLERSTLINM